VLQEWWQPPHCTSKFKWKWQINWPSGKPDVVLCTNNNIKYAIKLTFIMIFSTHPENVIINLLELKLLACFKLVRIKVPSQIR